MKIKSLHIYPIKSLGGISIQKAYAQFEGFKNDRRYMLLDENDSMISQRAVPRLASFKMEQVDEIFISICYNNQCVGLNLESEGGEEISTEVWGRKMPAKEADKNLSEWFSDMLGLKCRLVKLNEDGTNIKRYAPYEGGERTKETTISFADGYPFLVAGTGSLDFLNSKLESPIPMNRFRPNIVIETKNDAEEDKWTDYELGEAKFRNIKPCMRCSMTTIDQDIGEVSGKEPLKTLSTYRRNRIDNQGVNFGVNAVLLNEGWLKVT